ncbi:MAG: protein phosphatase 2C domain-containing protein [Synergistaceae bacterium]
MNTDSYFEIGNSHEVCQDFAISGNINENISFAIVTDGCTTSHNQCAQVDTGARILAYSAREALKKIWADKDSTIFENTTQEMVSEFLRNQSIVTTRLIERQLGLDPLCADCTLVVAVADKFGNAHSFVYGDGSVFVQLKDGSQHMMDVTFLSGAPLYLSYQTDEPRKIAYMGVYGNLPVLIDRYILDGGEIETKNSNQILAYDYGLYGACNSQWKDVDFISVTSDGAKSFLKNEGNETNTVPHIKIMNEFNAIKNRNGVFIQRRMKTMGKSNKKLNISHYDDISISAILVG